MMLDLSSYFESLEAYYEDSGEIDESELNFSDRKIKLINPVEYRVEIFTLDDGDREASINISYSYEEPCSRCLNSATNSVNTTLSGKLIEGKEEDIEDDNSLEQYIFYEDDRLDIIGYTKTQILLSLPMKTLCQPDCKGLCSTCGSDLNIKDCGCIEHIVDPRLAKLKDLFPKK